MGKLENKVAIITGGGSGIGAATAKLFLQEGAQVVIVGRTEEKLRKMVQGLNPENISYVVGDVAKQEDTQRYVQHAVERYGGIDVLVSNAAIEGSFKHILEHTLEEFDQVMSINTRGVWLSIKHAFPEMKKRGGGSIVVTSSLVGVSGFPAASAYTASKHAVVGLGRALALDGAPFNIRVNTVVPGLIDNDMLASLQRHLAPGAEEQLKGMLTARVPLKRFGTSEEVARLNLFLASADSSYITGGVYSTDGGVLASLM
jgi:NAD(P)-dependent dehydrogenase (short-subunit alcohol dehydrogenase family)